MEFCKFIPGCRTLMPQRCYMQTNMELQCIRDHLAHHIFGSIRGERRCSTCGEISTVYCCPKNMVMFRGQTPEQSHNIKIDNISFGRVGELKYLGKKP